MSYEEDDQKANNKNKNKMFFSLEEPNIAEPSAGKPWLHEDMDEQTKERYDIINQFEVKYLRTFFKKRNTENMDLVKMKISDFRYMVAHKIYEKCYKEVQEIKKHISIKKIEESLYNLPLFTEDDEYNEAHQKFLNCSSFERHLITRLDDKMKFLSFFYDFQYGICKKNCIESKFYGTKDDYENCILQCLKYTHKNIDPAIEGILDQLIDNYSHIIEHMISKDPKF
jgi:hypothetical protein